MQTWDAQFFRRLLIAICIVFALVGVVQRDGFQVAVCLIGGVATWFLKPDER